MSQDLDRFKEAALQQFNPGISDAGISTFQIERVRLRREYLESIETDRS
jgi:hypothetical protein